MSNPNCFAKSRFYGNRAAWLFDEPQEFIETYESRNWVLPVEYYESLFYCLPTEICELFNFNFVEFYDFILTKEKANES